MADYKIDLGIQLNQGDLSKIKTTLNNFQNQKKINLEIDKRKIDSQLNSIRKQIRNLGNIKVDLGGNGNIASSLNISSQQGQQIGRNIGKQINQGISQGLNNGANKLDAFKRSLQSIGMGQDEIDAVANRIKNLGVEIDTLDQKRSHIVGSGKKGKSKDILSVDISGVDKIGNAVKLTEQYDIATGKLIKSIDRVSTVQQRAGASTNTFAKQQKRAVSDLTSQINQLNRSAIDQNANRPIKDSSHLKSLESKYQEIIAAIQRMGNASSDTFEDERNNVRTLIAEYKSLKSEYKNAENVSMDFKGADFESGLKMAKNRLREFKAEAKGFPQIEQTVEELDRAIEGVGDKSSLDKFNDQLKVAKSELKAVKAEVSSNNDNLVQKIRIDIETEKFDNQMSQIKDKFNKLSDVDGSLDGLRASIKQVENAYEEMHKAAYPEDGVVDNERLIRAQREYAAAVAKTNNELKIQAREQSAANAKERLSESVASLEYDMLNWLKKNSKATKEYKAQIDALIDSLHKLDAADNLDQATVNGARAKFKNWTKDAEYKGLTGLNFLDSMKSKIKEYSVYFGAAEMFMYAEQGLREMFNTVKEIDTAMTGLYRVTDLTSAEYDSLFNEMISSAKEYGATLNDIINATTDWVRAGFDANTSLGLAEVTTMYQHISDLDYDTAAENLITAYNGFKDELNGAFSGDTVSAVGYIADILNELDNNYAATSAGIGEALTRSASALDLAGNSIQETAG